MRRIDAGEKLWVETTLVVVAVNFLTGSPQFLVYEYGDRLALPHQVVPIDMTSLEVAARLLHTCTGLQAKLLGHGWVDLVQGPISDAANRTKQREVAERWVAVPYGCMIPEPVEVEKPFQWLTLEEVGRHVSYMDHLEILTTLATRV